MKHTTIPALVSLLALTACASTGTMTTPPTSSSLVYFATYEVKESISTNKVVRVDFVRPPYETISVLLGPNPGSNVPAEGSIQMAPMPATGSTQWPYFQVQNGFAMLWGPWPMARTNTVSAGSLGTTYIVQHKGDKHRVILLKASKDLTVWKTADATVVREWKDVNKFVEFDKTTGQMKDPETVVAGTEVGDLVDYVNGIGELVGGELP